MPASDAKVMKESSDHSMWIEAARRLTDDPSSQVPCPNCGLAFLTVQDEQVDGDHIDRRLSCPNCGAHECVFKRVGIVENRIRSLALSKFDCAPLSRPQLDELLSVWWAAHGPASQEFSVADLAPEAVATRLESLSIADEDVLVCWPAFREGFKMKWRALLAHLTDLWYPGSDDVVVTSPFRVSNAVLVISRSPGPGATNKPEEQTSGCLRKVAIQNDEGNSTANYSPILVDFGC
jgi:hypothetical protein